MLHDAPMAFQFPVSRSVRAGIFIGAACGAIFICIVAWSWPTLWTGYAWQRLLSVAAALVWLMACSMAFKQWRATRRGYLVWQAGAWAYLETGSTEGHVRVRALHCVWDAQHFLLLRIVLEHASHSHPHWVWLDQAMGPMLWADLRRAVIFWQQGAR